MGFRTEIKDVFNWYQNLTSTARTVLMVIIFGGLLLVSKSFGALLGPLILVMFWSVLTIESRTVSIEALFAAGLAGLFAVIPITGVISFPFMFIWNGSQTTASVFNLIIECMIILSMLLFLSFWTGSRLRITGSIMDFTLIGLWIGAGLEFGIGLLGEYGRIFGGQVYGLLPQLPGLMGHYNLPHAAAAPSAVGLLFGLLVGLARYLTGPEIAGNIKRIIVAGIILLVLVWIGLERMAYYMSSLNPIAEFMYKLDLQGRLLVYLIYVLTAILIVVEWLLVSSSSLMADFKTVVKTYRQAWFEGEQTTLRGRIANVLDLAGTRRILREIVLAEDIKLLLSKKDIEKSEKRIADLQQALRRCQK